MNSANETRAPCSCGSSKTFGLAESALLVATVAGEREDQAQKRNYLGDLAHKKDCHPSSSERSSLKVI